MIAEFVLDRWHDGVAFDDSGRYIPTLGATEAADPYGCVFLRAAETAGSCDVIPMHIGLPCCAPLQSSSFAMPNQVLPLRKSMKATPVCPLKKERYHECLCCIGIKKLESNSNLSSARLTCTLFTCLITKQLP